MQAGDRIRVLVGINMGRTGEVMYLLGDGRVVVWLDRFSTSNGARAYDPAKGELELGALSPLEPEPVPAPEPEPEPTPSPEPEPAPEPEPTPSPASPIPAPPTLTSVTTGQTLKDITLTNAEYRNCIGGWISIKPSARNVVFRDCKFNAVSVDGGSDIWFINCELGPIVDSHPAIAGNSSNPRPQNIYFDAGLFHDITVSRSGIHNEGIQIRRGKNIRFYRTVFIRNHIFNIFVSGTGPGNDSVEDVLIQECELHDVDDQHSYCARVDDGASNQGGTLPRNVVFKDCKISQRHPISLNTQILGPQGCRQEGTQAIL